MLHLRIAGSKPTTMEAVGLAVRKRLLMHDNQVVTVHCQALMFYSNYCQGNQPKGGRDSIHGRDLTGWLHLAVLCCCQLRPLPCPVQLKVLHPDIISTSVSPTYHFILSRLHCRQGIYINQLRPLRARRRMRPAGGQSRSDILAWVSPRSTAFIVQVVKTSPC